MRPDRQTERGRNCARPRNERPSSREMAAFVILETVDSGGRCTSPSTPNVRPATEDEAADVPAMHAANRAAWDEAAERYEGWFDEAVALIRSGGSNLLPVEHDLIGDLHGRCRRAIHLQCAGGRDTLSLWNLGADEVVGLDFSPRMLDLGGAIDGGHRRAGPWVLADVLETPHDLDGTADLLYTGRGAILWLQDLDALGRGAPPAPRAGRPARDLRRAPGGVAVRRRRGRPPGSSPTTTTSPGPRPRAAGRPSTSTASRSPRTTSTSSSPGRGRWARS